MWQATGNVAASRPDKERRDWAAKSGAQLVGLWRVVLQGVWQGQGVWVAPGAVRGLTVCSRIRRWSCTVSWGAAA